MHQLLQTAIHLLPSTRQAHTNALREHLGIHTYEDLLYYPPLRYEDRVHCYKSNELRTNMDRVQVTGTLTNLVQERTTKGQILKATLADEAGTLTLLWFRKVHSLKQAIKPNTHYLAFGKPLCYKGRWSMVHPNLQLHRPSYHAPATLLPVYPTNEKATRAGLTNQTLRNLQRTLWTQVKASLSENLPTFLLGKYRLIGRRQALAHLHFPPTYADLHQAQRRLKFEELLFLQLHLIGHHKKICHANSAKVFSSKRLLKLFTAKHLPFILTKAQGRVLEEIITDMSSGKQMRRLLQGDVGSGKTVVAFMAMLMPWAHGSQCAFMAPTELLATQHYYTLKKWSKALGITTHLLTSHTPSKVRTRILHDLREGKANLLVGTHALLQEDVHFAALDLAIIDEQHRFGVMQRSKFYQKRSSHSLPSTHTHVLVMSATPIPRTLALTRYADLNLSLLDELPANRKNIRTLHRHDEHRLALFGFIRKQLTKGHQAYIVYPRIEESSNPKKAYKDLLDGYHSISRAFPRTPTGILHGRMHSEVKMREMRAFAQGSTKILVATTVVEVGIDVPNATIMVIEDAESYGLAQLHQLRGRIGRGHAPSFCVLMTSKILSVAAQKRIEVLLSTQDGFKIAEADMQMRGYGNLLGCTQSGLPPLRMAHPAHDEAILHEANKVALDILHQDPTLQQPLHAALKRHLVATSTTWADVG